MPCSIVVLGGNFAWQGCVGVGFVDEITDRHYVVIDGADARVHYVELGRLKPDNVPSRDNIVRITADRLSGKRQSAPRLQVLCRESLQRITDYDGPVWLDGLAQSSDRSLQGTRGFGAKLDQAIARRRQGSCRRTSKWSQPSRASGGKVVIMSDVTGCLRYLGHAGSRTSVDERFSGSCGLVGWSAAECAGYSDNVCWLNQEEFVFDKTCFPRAARIQG
jgi:hypothetical protein